MTLLPVPFSLSGPPSHPVLTVIRHGGGFSAKEAPKRRDLRLSRPGGRRRRRHHGRHRRPLSATGLRPLLIDARCAEDGLDPTHRAEHRAAWDAAGGPARSAQQDPPWHDQRQVRGARPRSQTPGCPRRPPGGMGSFAAQATPLAARGDAAAYTRGSPPICHPPRSGRPPGSVDHVAAVPRTTRRRAAADLSLPAPFPPFLLSLQAPHPRPAPVAVTLTPAPAAASPPSWPP